MSARQTSATRGPRGGARHGAWARAGRLVGLLAVVQPVAAAARSPVVPASAPASVAAPGTSTPLPGPSTPFPSPSTPMPAASTPMPPTSTPLLGVGDRALPKSTLPDLFPVRMQVVVQRNLPPMPGVPANASATVRVVADPDGRATTVDLLRSSGIPAFDAAVVQAVSRLGAPGAESLPVPGDPHIRQTLTTVGVVFEVTMDGKRPVGDATQLEGAPQ